MVAVKLYVFAGTLVVCICATTAAAATAVTTAATTTSSTKSVPATAISVKPVQALGAVETTVKDSSSASSDNVGPTSSELNAVLARPTQFLEHVRKWADADGREFLEFIHR